MLKNRALSTHIPQRPPSPFDGPHVNQEFIAVTMGVRVKNDSESHTLIGFSTMTLAWESTTVLCESGVG